MKGRLLAVFLLVALLLAGLSFPRSAHAAGSYCHLVRPGENLTMIAQRYGVTVSAIVRANNLPNPNLIYVGQCLVIPDVPPPSTSCTVTHIVQRGEYLKLIAARYGVGWRDIVAANGLTNPNLIYPGQRLTIPVKCRPTPTPTPTPEPGPKPWKGQYWDNQYLSGDPKLVRQSSSVNYDWKLGSPGKTIPVDGFSARFTRTKPFDAGRYRFHIRVDDGVRFWLDDVLLIDEWHVTGVVEYATDKDLSAGDHKLQIDYFEHNGGAQISFWVEKLGGQPLWTGEYFNNTDLSGDPLVTKQYSALDFDWGTNAPLAGITADYFSARWKGQFHFAGGRYRFTATTDDGMRIYLDDTLILDQWHLNPIRTYVVDVDVSAGTHRLKVEYYEYKGVAVAKVRWAQQ